MGLNNYDKFPDYIISYAKMKQLFLFKKEEKISMSFVVECLLKKHIELLKKIVDEENL